MRIAIECGKIKLYVITLRRGKGAGVLCFFFSFLEKFVLYLQNSYTQDAMNRELLTIRLPTLTLHIAQSLTLCSLNCGYFLNLLRVTIQV